MNKTYFPIEVFVDMTQDSECAKCHRISHSDYINFKLIDINGVKVSNLIAKNQDFLTIPVSKFIYYLKKNGYNADILHSSSIKLIFEKIKISGKIGQVKLNKKLKSTDIYFLEDGTIRELSFATLHNIGLELKSTLQESIIVDKKLIKTEIEKIEKFNKLLEEVGDFM